MRLTTALITTASLVGGAAAGAAVYQATVDGSAPAALRPTAATESPAPVVHLLPCERGWKQNHRICVRTVTRVVDPPADEATAPSAPSAPGTAGAPSSAPVGAGSAPGRATVRHQHPAAHPHPQTAPEQHDQPSAPTAGPTEEPSGGYGEHHEQEAGPGDD